MGAVCQMCHSASSVPRTKASSRPSAFCWTLTLLVITPPREAQPDQPLLGAVCQMCHSGVVGAAGEHLQPPVGVARAQRLAGDDAAQRRPAGPAVVGRGLPDVPQAVVGADPERLQPAIQVLADAADPLVARFAAVVEIHLAVAGRVAVHDRVLAAVSDPVHRRPVQRRHLRPGADVDLGELGHRRVGVVPAAVDAVGLERLVAPLELGDVLHRQQGAVYALELRGVAERAAGLPGQGHHPDEGVVRVHPHQVGVECLAA